ncbi:MAG: hypothetical protein ACOX3A_11335 [bacterium]
MQVVILRNRLWWQLLCIGLLILLLFYLIGVGNFSLHRPSPNEIVNKAISNLEAAYSYRYLLRAHSVVDGQDTFLLDIEGIWNRPDHYYIKGETLSNPLEAYIIGEEFIVKDPEGEWLHFKGGPSLVRETISFSASPLADLTYLHSPAIAAEKMYKGKKCYIIEGVLASVSNPLWQAFWQNFSCRLWIDKKELKLLQMDLHGQSIGSDDTLSVCVELYDYDGNFAIRPPETVNNSEE